jgi:hypothetical protein
MERVDFALPVHRVISLTVRHGVGPGFGRALVADAAPWWYEVTPSREDERRAVTWGDSVVARPSSAGRVVRWRLRSSIAYLLPNWEPPKTQPRM